MDRMTRNLHRFVILTMLVRLSLGECDYQRSYYAQFCWKKYDDQYLRKVCHYYTGREYVICRNLTDGLQEVGEYHTKSYIGGLEVLNSSIDEIKTTSLKDLTRLTYLMLDHTNISAIQSGAFSDLANLRNLHMSYNAIGALPNDMFNAFTKLQVLDMSHNKIKSIANDSFSTLSEIDELHLNNNELSDISFLIGNCKQLKYLDLSYNGIEYFPISGCVKLNHLRIGSNRMKKFNGDLFKNFELLHLDVSNNDFLFIGEDSFKHLSSLRYLNLSQNPLFRTAPIRVDQFKNMKHLSYLGLSSTFLREFPPGTFTPFNDLDELDLSFNNLTRVPTHEGARNLHLNNNCLTNFEYDGRLSSVFLDNNLWSCATLMSLLNKYKDKINPGHTYNTTNIKGIGCRNSIGDSNAHTSKASMNVLIQEYLMEFIHEQDEIIEQFDRFKHLVRQRNRNIEHFSEDYLKKLRRSLFFRNASLYFIAFASIFAIVVGVLCCHRRNRGRSNNSEQRNLSSALGI